MAPRKRQLLDLLRTQQREAQQRAPIPSRAPASVPPHAPAAAPAPVAAAPSAPAHSAPAAPQSTLLTRTRQAPSWRPWVLRAAFVAVWLVLLVWLVSRLWPDGAEPSDAGKLAGGGAPAAAPPESASRGAGAPAAPSAPPAQGPTYGVLAITYQGAAHEQQAAEIALELREALKPHPVTVRKHTKSGKTWFEVLIGQETDRTRLDALVAQVRALSLASQPGKKPFSDAFVKQIPATTP